MLRSLAISAFSVNTISLHANGQKQVIKKRYTTGGNSEIFIKASRTPVLSYVSVKDRIDSSSYKITKVRKRTTFGTKQLLWWLPVRILTTPEYLRQLFLRFKWHPLKHRQRHDWSIGFSVHWFIWFVTVEHDWPLPMAGFVADLWTFMGWVCRFSEVGRTTNTSGVVNVGLPPMHIYYVP